MTWEEFEAQEVARLKARPHWQRMEYIRYITGRMNGDMAKLKKAWGDGRIKQGTYVYIVNKNSTSSSTMGIYNFSSMSSSSGY